ncbi:putative tagatose 6-phosphate kinase [Escherichia coli]|uniref:Putative tagatose 6-phosphate kinase n=1 Tax=Escherichia coli TaxID=562 RepID=A0A376ZGE1_ECOLX|nr:putative tagatose 6-phosphate kinase [Escherichia coli]
MMVNLEGVDIPLGMISQYLPKHLNAFSPGNYQQYRIS